MAEKAVVRTENAPAPFQGAPYSQAVRYGDLVFVAGQVGLKPEHDALVHVLLDRAHRDRELRETAADPLGHVGLIPAAEMPGEELLDPREQGLVRLLAREAVPLVGGHQVLHLAPQVAKRTNDLIGFRLLHARVVGSLHHQERGADPLRGV